MPGTVIRKGLKKASELCLTSIVNKTLDNQAGAGAESEKDDLRLLSESTYKLLI